MSIGVPISFLSVLNILPRTVLKSVLVPTEYIYPLITLFKLENLFPPRVITSGHALGKSAPPTPMQIIWP